VARKLGSSPLFPSRCRGCAALLVPRRSFAHTLVDSVIALILMFGSAFTALLLWSWWPLLIGVAVDLIVVQLVLHWSTPLVVLDEERVASARRNAVITLAVLIVLVIVAGLTERS
jgi:hypothetical protein